MNPDPSKYAHLKQYAPVILRLGLAFVFAWFGITQLMGPEAWARLIPEWLTNLTGMSAVTFVYLNGGAEILAALLLICNVWTSVVAFLLFLHLVTIVLDVGFNAIGVRDIGLAVSCLALSMWACGSSPARQM